jgi:hypothetical protein
LESKLSFKTYQSKFSKLKSSQYLKKEKKKVEIFFQKKNTKISFEYLFSFEIYLSKSERKKLISKKEEN